MRTVICLALALPCSGCLYHEVRVSAASPPGAAAGRSAVATAVADGAPAAHRRGPLPAEVPVLWSLRDADGGLLVGRDILRSPLPWWQRFPADLAVDLWPGDVVVAAAVEIVPAPIAARTAADITAEARAHGYAP